MTTDTIPQQRNSKGQFINGRWKKGESGNPKGRKPVTADEKERRRVFTQILRSQFTDDDVGVDHILKAGDLLNKMDKLYVQEAASLVLQDNRVVNIIVKSDNAKELTQDIESAIVRRLGSGSSNSSQTPGT